MIAYADPGIIGTSVHGRTSTETDGSGRLLQVEVCLPVELTINTPYRPRLGSVGTDSVDMSGTAGRHALREAARELVLHRLALGHGLRERRPRVASGGGVWAVSTRSATGAGAGRIV